MDEFSGFSEVPRLRPATARAVRGLLLTETVCPTSVRETDFRYATGVVETVAGPVVEPLAVSRASLG